MPVRAKEETCSSPCGSADIFHVRPAAYSLNAVIKLHVRNRFNTADLIFHMDFQLAAELVVLVRK